MAALQSVLATNDLQGKGKKPYYLALDFQVMDLKGLPQEKGTVEQWWAGPDGAYVTVTAPSVGTVHDTATAHLPDEKARRVMYLVSQLLGELQSPKFPLQADAEIVTAPKSFGQAVLMCTTKKQRRPDEPGVALCVDGANGTIRYTETGVQVSLRNRLATFDGTKLGLDTSIDIIGRRAIEGHVTTLKSFDPKISTVPLQKKDGSPEGDESSPSAQTVTGDTVMKGHLLQHPEPVYPDIAKMARVTGTVVLAAEISTTGRITDLFTVATASSLLTDAARDAVRQWVYEPYQLKGVPTAVNTTVTVNFNLNGMRH